MHSLNHSQTGRRSGACWGLGTQTGWSGLIDAWSECCCCCNAPCQWRRAAHRGRERICWSLTWGLRCRLSLNVKMNQPNLDNIFNPWLYSTGEETGKRLQFVKINKSIQDVWYQGAFGDRFKTYQRRSKGNSYLFIII